MHGKSEDLPAEHASLLSRKVRYGDRLYVSLLTCRFPSVGVHSHRAVSVVELGIPRVHIICMQHEEMEDMQPNVRTHTHTPLGRLLDRNYNSISACIYLSTPGSSQLL